MTTKKTSTLASEDTKRHTFSPIQMDLVERLTRECDSMASRRPLAVSEHRGDKNKLAA